MTVARRVDRGSVVLTRRDASGAPTPAELDAVTDPVTGALVLVGRVSRGDCVLEYSDGVETWGELRLVADVYDEAAMRSISTPKAIVDSEHAWVDPDTYSSITKGSTGVAEIKDGWCVQQLVIQARDEIERVKRGESIEISKGYECTLVEESGEYEGVPYRYRQTNVRDNHTALGPRDWARAGNDARLIFDANPKADAATPQLAIQVGDAPMAQSKKNKNKTNDRAPKGSPLPTASRTDRAVTIGDVEYEVPDEVADYLMALQDRLAEKEGEDMDEEPAEDMDDEEKSEDMDDEEKSDSKRKPAKTADATAERLRAVEDGFERYRKGEAERADARAELIADAREVLGRHADTRGKPAIEIQRLVIDRLLGSDGPDLGKASAEYVQATYDLAMKSRDSGRSVGRAIGSVVLDANSGRKSVSLDSAYQQFLGGKA